MTAEERLGLIRVKVERAKKHISDLEVGIQAFRDSQPYTIEIKPNPKTGENVHYISSIREIPSVIAVTTGDILYNLRAALDHLAYQLAWVKGTRDKGILGRTYFPIFDSAKKYKTGKSGKVEGLSQAAIDAIDATEPYKGGNDTLWQLHRLNIIDKHRIILAVANILEGIGYDTRVRRQMIKGIYESSGHTISEDEIKRASRSMLVKPFLHPPLKAGDILTRDPFKREADDDVYFVIEVTLDEPEIIGRKPLLPTLIEMSDCVDSLITNFKLLLR
jgi:hypothetical protein